MKLIKLIDFVLEHSETSTMDISQIDWYDVEWSKLNKIRNYANFLNTPLELSMFITVGEDGNVLLKPDTKDYEIESNGFEYVYDSETYEQDLGRYNEAMDNVLFEGFECDLVSCVELIIVSKIINKHSLEILSHIGIITIEDLISEIKDLTLTKSAIIKFGL